MTLIELYEADIDRLRETLLRDRTTAAAMDAVDKELNRIALRCAGESQDAARRDGAQLLLNALRSALPLIDVTAEVRTWKRDVSRAEAKREKLPVRSVVMLAGGGLLILGALLTLHTSNPLTMALSLACAAGGGALAFFGGRASRGKPAPSRADDAPVRTETLVDVEKLMHTVRGLLLFADGRLEELARARESEIRATPTLTVPGADANISEEPIDLLSDLLEIAYAQRSGANDADAREMISGMRYYLHAQGIELEDYTEAHRAWFELLPASEAGTMRPAMTRDGKLVRKGTAALGNQ